MQDSLEKTLVWLSRTARHPFTYKGQVFNPPQRLYLSDKFFRDYTCPAECGACCVKHTRVFFEWEYQEFQQLYPQYVDRFVRGEKEVNGKTLPVWEYDDPGLKVDADLKCSFLIQDKSNPELYGRCMIHKRSPFGCRFALTNVVSKGRDAMVTKILPGRLWQRMKVCGERKGLCEMIAFNINSYEFDLQLIRDMIRIAEAYEIETWLPDLLRHLEEVKTQIAGLNGKRFELKGYPMLVGVNDFVVDQTEQSETLSDEESPYHDSL